MRVLAKDTGKERAAEKRVAVLLKIDFAEASTVHIAPHFHTHYILPY